MHLSLSTRLWMRAIVLAGHVTLRRLLVTDSDGGQTTLFRWNNTIKNNQTALESQTRNIRQYSTNMSSYVHCGPQNTWHSTGDGNYGQQ